MWLILGNKGPDEILYSKRLRSQPRQDCRRCSFSPSPCLPFSPSWLRRPVCQPPYQVVGTIRDDKITVARIKGEARGLVKLGHPPTPAITQALPLARLHAVRSSSVTYKNHRESASNLANATKRFVSATKLIAKVVTAERYLAYLVVAGISDKRVPSGRQRLRRVSKCIPSFTVCVTRASGTAIVVTCPLTDLAIRSL